MKLFFNYLIIANLSICFFLLVYHFLLRKETDHRFNRTYLLIALAASLALPLFRISLPSLPVLEETLPTYWLPEIQVTPLQSNTTFQFSFWFLVQLVYALGAGVFFLLFLIRLSKIIAAIYRSPRMKDGSLWLVELNNSGEVFSFFKFIFIGKLLSITADEKQQIVRHEQIHISSYHSLDILLINLVGILFWFNPFIKTYRKAFIQLHEFEADARSVDRGEVDSYCCLLAKAALELSGYQLANHFTNSLTLKRIEMMKTIKTKISNWKVISIASAAIVFCLVMGCANTRSLSKSSKNEVYSQVDELPTFGNGPQYIELYDSIAKKLVYPEEARKKGIEGKVFTKFVVEKDGTVTNVSVVNGIGSGCDEAAVNVIKQLPQWNPGKKDGKIVRTSFVIPILFKISDQKKGD